MRLWFFLLLLVPVSPARADLCRIYIGGEYPTSTDPKLWTPAEWKAFIGEEIQQAQTSPVKTSKLPIRPLPSELNELVHPLVGREKEKFGKFEATSRFTFRRTPIGVVSRIRSHHLDLLPGGYATFHHKIEFQKNLEVHTYDTDYQKGLPFRDPAVIAEANRLFQGLELSDLVAYLNPERKADSSKLQQLVERDLANPTSPARRFFEERAKRNHQLRIELLTEILEAVLPDYAKRRDWDNIEKQQQFVRQAYETLDNTSYTVVREPKTGRILGVMGLTYAAYGAVEVMSPGRCEFFYGPFGAAYESYHGEGLSPAQIADFVTNPTAHKSLLRLPTEEVFHRDLPRPITPEGTLGGPIRLRDGRTLLPTIYQGVIGEPVKFWMRQEGGESTASERHQLIKLQIISALQSAMLLMPDPALIQSRAFAVYTYGDPLSFRLYRPLGFVSLGHQKSEHGIEWSPLVLSALRLRELLTNGGTLPRDMDDLQQALREFFGRK